MSIILNKGSGLMTVEIDDKSKVMIFWLEKSESTDKKIQSDLQSAYVECKRKGYKVITFFSGSKDLLEQTEALLTHNKMVN